MADHALATITNPVSALTDFTLIVDLSNLPASWWSAVDTTDGTKGRVYKGDGVTRLPADWIDFDSVADTGILRVKWTGTLASTGTQELWIEPPLAANASVAVTATFGGNNAYDANWAGYWPDGGSDRVSGGTNGTAYGGAIIGGATGRIGDATNLDGVDDAVSYGSVAPITSGTEMTALAWAYPSTLTGTVFNDGDAIIAKTNTTSADNAYEWAIQVENGQIYFRTLGGNNGGTTATIGTLAWSHVGVAYTAGGTADTFVNGSGQASSVNDLSPNDGYPIAIGSNSVSKSFQSGDHNFDGIIGEAQVHTTRRTTDWVNQEYNQTSANDTFYTTWTYVTGGGAVTGTGSPQAQTAIASGTGERLVSGSGTPQASTATISGTGERTITGSGSPQATRATATGIGLRVITGTGSPSAQAATTTGTGSVSGAVSGTSSVNAQPATASGTGTRIVTGSGTAQATEASASGTGQVAGAISGTGAVQAQRATATGVGLRVVNGQGTGQAQRATASGTGSVQGAITGTGTAQAQRSTATGVGLRVITGTGSVQAQRAAAEGSDRGFLPRPVIKPGSIDIQPKYGTTDIQPKYGTTDY